MGETPTVDDVTAALRTIPDFPKPGIQYKDITPVLADPKLRNFCRDQLAGWAREANAAGVAAVDARGFVFGTLVADVLGLPLALIRKAGKLPAPTHAEAYALEYGEAVLELHGDLLNPGQRIVVVDDLLATGGTAAATCKLLQRAGAHVAACLFVCELGFLEGRQAVPADTVRALLTL